MVRGSDANTNRRVTRFFSALGVLGIIPGAWAVWVQYSILEGASRGPETGGVPHGIALSAALMILWYVVGVGFWTATNWALLREKPVEQVRWVWWGHLALNAVAMLMPSIVVTLHGGWGRDGTMLLTTIATLWWGSLSALAWWMVCRPAEGRAEEDQALGVSSVFD